ncbi:Nucleoside-diphosphate-sugar epimerase [Noviherbaspirillum humi]|uniref:Nucleoside-diphosphate-sugar epimerase n=1 Tax=Noviherbaspirillum humi TaxID=1688639 RepID=A0A239HDZ9_9BURK|nr:SDR family oxidoreductase [Noviherbaspirillum humi]SNS79580.1 Nucleoside-diphosphate-sugar epimerase [Noviherbaspirillum humi]
MQVLLTGASGFIGRQIAEALLQARHEVTCAVRDPARQADPRMRYVAADFTRDLDRAAWAPRLQSVEAVINAVGIIREQGAQTFSAIHESAPKALFAACAEAGVPLVIQISALGADEHAASRYHLSKRAADDYLASLPLHSLIVQPSLVYGPGGASARLFGMLASLPLIGLPGQGRQTIQPVHIDDAVAAVVALLQHPERRPTSGSRIALVGPQPMTLRDYLARLRAAMGMGRPLFFSVPISLVRVAASVADRLPGSLLDPETLGMLERGNTADAGAITRLLGHAPRPVEAFIAAGAAPALRARARLDWLLPIVRLTVALVWIVTGIVSLGLYPVQESYALLARVGVTGVLAPVMLYGAALLDLGFGIATLFLRGRLLRRLMWLGQIAVIAFYTLIISWRLPEFWLHPYGPLLKNLPMLAAIWLLMEMEKE